MRVAMVGPFPLEPERFGGGVERAASILLEGLITFDDMEIHAVTCSTALTEPRLVEHNGVIYHYLPSRGRLETLTLYAADRRKVHRVLRDIDPDLVHAQDAHKYGYICLQAGYPLVMSLHGIAKEERKHFNTIRDKLRATMMSLLVERHCLRNAPYLIQPTRYPEQCLGQWITGKAYDIANPVATKFFDLDSIEEEGRLLFVGSVIPRKRPLDLVKALSRVRDQVPYVTLRIAGRTSDQEYLGTIREWIESHDLEPNVRILGSVTEDQLLGEYQRCVLLALPSVEETSPIVIAEAMAVGKPVVATRVGGVAYLVDDGQTGFLVDVGDIDALSSRILTILSNDGLRSSMKKAAREKADLNYRSEIAAARVRQVYQEAVETRKRRLM